MIDLSRVTCPRLGELMIVTYDDRAATDADLVTVSVDIIFAGPYGGRTRVPKCIEFLLHMLDFNIEMNLLLQRYVHTFLCWVDSS